MHTLRERDLGVEWKRAYPASQIVSFYSTLLVMRITAKDVIAGQPALAIRELLRSYRLSSITPSTISTTLNLNETQSKQVLAQLEAEGFLEPHPYEPGAWVNTVKGNALANATAAKPIHRKTANNAVTELLDRAQQLRERDELLYLAAEVVVFGSYLGQSDRLGDVDLLIRLERKARDRDVHLQRCNARIAQVQQQGRHFSNLVDRIYWPQTEVRRFLRARKSMLSMVSEDQYPWLWSQPFQVLYVDVEWAARWPGTSVGYAPRPPTISNNQPEHSLPMRMLHKQSANMALFTLRAELPLVLNDRLGKMVAEFFSPEQELKPVPEMAAGWPGFLETVAKGGYDAVVLTEEGLSHLSKIEGIGTEPATFLLKPGLAIRT